MNEYEINSETLAIIPEDKNLTRIYENEKTFLVNRPSLEIMEESCAYFGSSLIGRQKGTQSLIGISHKAPIIIEESKEIIFFPTTSPRLEKCSWISLKNIEKYYRENGTINIEFKSGKKISFPLSYGVLDNQILRATRLESVLRQRKSKKTLENE